jgi:hypothetical protein
MRLQVAENNESQELLETIKQIITNDNAFFKGRLAKIEKKNKIKGKIFPRLILDNGTKITDLSQIEMALMRKQLPPNNAGAAANGYSGQTNPYSAVTRRGGMRNYNEDSDQITIERDGTGKPISERIYDDDEEAPAIKDKKRDLANAKSKMREKTKPNTKDVGSVELPYMSEPAAAADQFDSYLSEIIKSKGGGDDY